MEAGTFYVLGTIGIMIVAGMLGSFCRRIFDRENVVTAASDRGGAIGFFEIVIPGIVASFAVPLFLSIGKSEVFPNLINGTHFAENGFIVFGFCVLAAVSARSFVTALAQRALQKAEAAEKKADEATELISEEPRTSPPETKGRATLDAMARFQGSAQEKLILEALVSGNFIRRSITGIANETKLEKPEIRKNLENLVARGLVAEVRSERTGGLLYQASLENPE